MSVRKRTWVNGKGEDKTSWVVDYVDTQGKRRLKTFKLKKQADQFAATASVEVREGIHVADSASVTVKEAAALWIASGENAGLERSTMNQRKRHIEFHILPFIGTTLLSRLTVPSMREFQDQLHKEGRSPAMVRKVIGSVGSILSDAQERGLAMKNPVRDMKSRRGSTRHKRKLAIGVDIPTREEIRAVVEALEGHWRPLLLTAVFTGMRSSELRGLRWQDIDFDRREISIRQRIDEFGQVGRPKTGAGERTLPVPPLIINTLKEWKLACPQSGLDLVFPNGSGNPESHANIVNRGLMPTMVAAGITTILMPSDDGQPVTKAKYTGLHALRHFYASWCINRPQDGGLGLPLKVVQERMGHSSITMTADTYGHLFPRGDNADEMAAAEQSLLG